MKREDGDAWKRYQNSLTYLSQIGLKAGAPRFVDMYEGRQWPPVTELTRNMPRPVINIIKMVARNKKSGVLSSPVKLHYKTDSKSDTEKIDHFAEYIAKEIELEERDSEAIDDKIKKGTCCWHFYWDKSAAGKRGNTDGAVAVEIIEPLNVHLANPNEKDEQKQKWIIISSREEWDAVEAKTPKKYKDKLVTTASDSAYQETEQEGTKYITILTEYFRDKTGAVFFQKHTKAGAISDPTPMTPQVVEQMGLMEAEDGLPDADSEIETPTSTRVFERYPVVIGVWDERDKSAYGIGEVESLEHNQKAINLGMALQLLKIQHEAFGKWLVKEDALVGQEINNSIAQVLIDHSKLGDGVKKIAETPISGTPMNIINGLLEQTRMVTGATEVMTGEIIGANMSGAAIATLQAQAMKPIEEKQKSFWRDKQRQGLILAEFFRFYYDNREFSYEEKDADGKVEQKTDTFIGSEYMEGDFRVVVEAGAAATFSESGDIAMLEQLLAKGLISGQTFAEAYPDSALSNKTKIREAMEREQQSQLSQLTQQMQQMQMQMEKAAEVMKAQSETVDKAATVISENRRLKAELIALQAEYTEKINQANQGLMEAQTDAAAFAEQLMALAGQGLPQTPVTQAQNPLKQTTVK